MCVNFFFGIRTWEESHHSQLCCKSMKVSSSLSMYQRQRDWAISVHLYRKKCKRWTLLPLHPQVHRCTYPLRVWGFEIFLRPSLCSTSRTDQSDSEWSAPLQWVARIGPGGAARRRVWGTEISNPWTGSVGTDSSASPEVSTVGTRWWGGLYSVHSPF